MTNRQGIDALDRAGCYLLSSGEVSKDDQQAVTDIIIPLIEWIQLGWKPSGVHAYNQYMVFNQEGCRTRIS